MNNAHWLNVPMSQTTLMLFDLLAEKFALEPSELALLLIHEVVDIDTQLRRLGLGGLLQFRNNHEEGLPAMARLSISGLPVDLSPTESVWPSDLPFDWNPAECKAALLGFRVRWRGSLTDFKNHMPGNWHINSGGFVHLKRRRSKNVV